MLDQNIRWSHDAAPTLNFHMVAACNYGCEFCFARFIDARREPRLPVSQKLRILRDFKERGGKRVRFAGGEPTLDPQFADLLEGTAQLGLVTSVVTHGRHLDLSRHLPWLRHVTVSVDSDSEETSARLGRQLKGQTSGHVANVERMCSMLREWNRVRPPERRVHLAFNIVVTSVNAHEDLRNFIRRCRPEKIKMLQMLSVEGENDHARHLICPVIDFDTFVLRHLPLREEGFFVVAETNDDMDGSYMMVDPRGRFFQRRDARYVYSRPILEVGFDAAFAEVGGYRRDRFVARGADYDPGRVPDGNLPYWIAIEGLDGSGKSTIVSSVAEHLDAAIVTNPPKSMASERLAADAMPENERRAWYRRGNYESAREAIRILKNGRPAVMDRSYASTAAFAAATAGRIAGPDDRPGDLPWPDAIILLDTSEDIRMERLMRRDIPATAEEMRLWRDPAFRERVLAGYRNLGARPIDATRRVTEILSDIVRSIDA